MTPIISVVTRAFNCEKYIIQAIESIRQQTFRDFELIIVDDASTDQTASILAAYAAQDDRVRIVRNTINQGAVKTMNRGLHAVRGPFIAVQDADDVSFPQRLETQIALLAARPEFAMIGGEGVVIDDDGEEILRRSHIFKDTAEFKAGLQCECPFFHSSVMYRRAALESIGGYDEFFPCSHDYDVYIRLAERFELLYYPEPLIQWRWLATGISGKHDQLQSIYMELARKRSHAKLTGLPFDLQAERDRLLAQIRSSNGNPDLKARYYYTLGLLLLDRGKISSARTKLKRALLAGHHFDILARSMTFYLLSFVPGSANSKPVRTLRKIF